MNRVKDVENDDYYDIFCCDHILWDYLRPLILQGIAESIFPSLITNLYILLSPLSCTACIICTTLTRLALISEGVYNAFPYL